MTTKIWQDLVWINITSFNIEHITTGNLCRFLDTKYGSLPDNANRRLILQSLGEGHGTREALALSHGLQNLSWYDPNKVVFLHNTNDRFDNPIKDLSWPWYMVDHCGWYSHFQNLKSRLPNLTRSKDIVCLMRRPSARRKDLLQQLTQRFSMDRMTLSYGSLGNPYLMDGIEPILIDGYSTGASLEQQHRASDPVFFDAVFNVIAESCNQEDQINLWCSKFITEKTFKCFAWQQIPVWYTVPDFVDGVRDMGFDVFDDLMDHHAYDKLQDSQARLGSMLDTLDRAIGQISNRQAFMKDILPRLQANYQKLSTLVGMRHKHWQRIIYDLKNI